MKVLWLLDSMEDQVPVQDPAGDLPDHCTAKIVGSLGEALFDLAHDRQSFAACIVQLPMEDDAAVILEELLRAQPGLPVLFLRERGPATEAVQLLKLGAWHYFDAIPDQDDFARVLDSLPSPQPSPPHLPARLAFIVGRRQCRHAADYRHGRITRRPAVHCFDLW